MSSGLSVRETIIPGLYEIDLELHEDERGWFKENYQKAKMEALGLPSFEVVQNNFSFNKDKGVTRGVANGYQTIEENITYNYLVNSHWSPEAKYTFVNLFDPALGIDWPIPKDQAIVSNKDALHPLLKDVIPMEV